MWRGSDRQLGHFRFALFLAILLFNYTDATFKALHPLWFVFYIIALEYPAPAAELEPAPQSDRENEFKCQLA